MIVDLTDSFFEEAATSRKSYTQSNWTPSQFLKSSTSHLSDLTQLDSKLKDLERQVRKGVRFQRQSLSTKIVNVKEHLKICEQNIKRIKSQQVDIKSRKQMAQKLKQSILIAMELRLLTATFRFRDIHLTFARGTTSSTRQQQPQQQSQRAINLSKSHFLQQSQGQVLQQMANSEYKQIQKSIHQISQMYKQTMHVVRMQQLLIDNIEGHIEDADQNVSSGRKQLSELNSKQQKNRQFIYKVFSLLYLIVFVYLVLLS